MWNGFAQNGLNRAVINRKRRLFNGYLVEVNAFTGHFTRMVSRFIGALVSMPNFL
jgi:hypothetical protein